jgi:small subunit ribosomal protein S9
MAEESNINEPDSRGMKNLDKALSEFNESLPVKQVAPIAKKAGTKRTRTGKTKKAKSRIITSRGKRKRAIARASLTDGSGEVYINGLDASLITPREIRELILEPTKLNSIAADIAKGSRIWINVRGGGTSGRAQASRSAIAKVIVEASGDDSLRKFFMDYDRSMLVDDYRRIEPKKFKGPKARARFQTSYR